MANRIVSKRKRLQRRKSSIRRTVSGTADCPRLSIFRSSKHIYAQIIDDRAGTTLCSSSTVSKEMRDAGYGGNKDAAKRVGEDIATKAAEAGVTKIVFDRNGYRYQGRLQVLADAAREKGLIF